MVDKVELVLEIARVEMPAHNYYCLTLAQSITYQEKEVQKIFVYSYDQNWMSRHEWLLNFSGKLKYKGDLDGNAPEENSLANYDEVEEISAIGLNNQSRERERERKRELILRQRTIRMTRKWYV